ncbi:hypothetical protein [Mesorhizobium sp.]|uniref:hypothetical protein n=1 Tax=Mesorhizobium sp. TaxID=1871066 RepID=UPI000FE2B666|nr:hypothetical protein [Mesorhizobium sp.]RWQ16092.1 MAG: hypothetical protein EOR92_22720 [Mesorhizobium sp.]
MAGFQFFERDLKLATAGMEPDAIDKALAAFAKQELKRVIGEGIASPTYERYVNGVHNAPEEAVKAPGPIVYEFVNWPLVINAALAELQKRSPRRSGKFASSFIVIAGGRAVATDFSKIRPDAEIIITNFMPTVRKAEVGYLGIPEQRLFQGAARLMGSRFRGAYSFEAKFLNIRAGLHAQIPYRLKRGTRRYAVGSPIAYPSILINAL